jgi:hypothetical protein
LDDDDLPGQAGVSVSGEEAAVALLQANLGATVIEVSATP